MSNRLRWVFKALDNMDELWNPNKTSSEVVDDESKLFEDENEDIHDDNDDGDADDDFSKDSYFDS